MNNIGIEISQEGRDVLRVGDNKLIFSSIYPSLKIHSSGSGTVTFTDNEGVEVLSEHGFGYKPFFFVWVDYGDGYKLASTGLVESDYSTGYYGTTDTDQLELVAVTEFVGYIDPWDEWWVQPDPPANREVNYAWVIYYDPIG
jgi:hypothetical protein